MFGKQFITKLYFTSFREPRQNPFNKWIYAAIVVSIYLYIL